MPEKSPLERFRDAERAARAQEALERTQRPPVATAGPAPLPGVPGPSAGAHGQLRPVDGGFELLGRPVATGDVIEVYTNPANGWLRARFEVGADRRARIAVHLWNLDGPRDEDGLPPWVGELDSALPPTACCRWPAG